MKKEWKTVKDYPKYKISNYGEIYSEHIGRLLKLRVNRRNGYVYVTLYNHEGSKGFRVHKLVARHFISEPPFHHSVVGHRDNTPTNNRVDNLYWTTVKGNTEDAYRDGLCEQKTGVDNPLSRFVKVLDKNTMEIVGLYGSMHECSRCIENMDVSTLSKTIREETYKPRMKKYIYLYATEQDFEQHPELVGSLLVESEKNNKKPKRFIIRNLELGVYKECDNQTYASKVTGISQANISHAIRSGAKVNGWEFILIEEVNYSESSSYKNFIEASSKSVKATNVFTNEVLLFPTQKSLMNHFKLSGHGLGSYYSGNLLFSEWKLEVA